MENFSILYQDTAKNIIKRILFVGFISICMGIILSIIGVRREKSSFLEVFCLLNIIFFVGYFLSKRLSSIRVSDQEVIFTFYRFIFYKQEERYLLKDIELEEEKEVVRANVNWLMIFYHKNHIIYKENMSNNFTDKERESIKTFFYKKVE